MRPYIPPDNWILSKTVFAAEVRGLKENSPFQISVIPSKPWIEDIKCMRGNLESVNLIRLKLNNIPQQGWLVVSDETFEDIWLISRINNITSEYTYSDFQYLLSNEYVFPNYLEKNISSDSVMKEMISLIHLAEIVRNTLIPVVNSPIPKYLEKLFYSQDNSNKGYIHLSNKWGTKKAKIIPPISEGKTTMLSVDGQEFQIQVTNLGEEINLLWSEASPPCICMHCDKIMTQGQWQAHASDKHLTNLTVLSRQFTAKRFIDWQSIMEFLECLLVDAINANPNTTPNGLGNLWTELQQAYKIEGRIQGVDPCKWIKGVFNSWFEISKLINSESHNYSWLPIWERVSGYKNGLNALSKVL